MISFVIAQYSLVIVFYLSLLGFGYFFLDVIQKKNSQTIDVSQYIVFSLGAALLICFSQVLLIGKMFIKEIYIFLFLLGLIYFFKHYLKDKNNFPNLNFFQHKNYFLFPTLIIIILVAPLFIKIITAPISWDAVMYHLPHAKEWAKNSYLSINTNYRYPSFPFNINIIYAIPYLFGNTTFPKAINGLFGFISILLITKHLCKNNFMLSFFAIVIWIYVARGMFERTYVELGLAFFITSSLISYILWAEKNKAFYLLLSFFLMGIAVGIKYQALFFLPGYAFLILYDLKKIKFKWFPFLVFIFLIPCIYWYLRNYILLGDPVSPVGSKLFGFNEWNILDFNNQFNLLNEKRYFTKYILLLFPLSIFIYKQKHDVFFNRLYIFSFVTFIIWLVFSGYERYLFGLFPILSYLTAIVIYRIFNYFENNKFSKIIINCLFLLIFLIVCVDNTRRIAKDIKKVGFDNESMNRVLLNQIYSYDGIKHLNESNNIYRTYQFGLEASIFYFNKPVFGDHFGKYRYHDYIFLTSNELYKVFKLINIDSIIINKNTFSLIGIEKKYHTKIAENRIRSLMHDEKFFLNYSNDDTFIFVLR